MDCYDYLFKMKNQFYLGHYQQVFESWVTLETDLDFESSEFASQKVQYIELLVFMHKSMNHFLTSDPETIKANQAMLEKFKDSMGLYLEYFGESANELSEGNLEEELKKSSEVKEENENESISELITLSKKIIHNYVCFRARKFDLLVTIDKKYPEAFMDAQMLKFQAFCLNNQFKEAQRIYEQMKDENDEHILVNFCEYEVENRINRNHEEALAVLLEMKQKFGESPKLINLNVASLLLKGEFFKVGLICVYGSLLCLKE